MADLPTFRSQTMRRILTDLFGLPNAAPRENETPWGTRRVVFVDDADDGRPIAYWESEEDSDAVQPRQD